MINEWKLSMGMGYGNDALIDDYLISVLDYGND